MELLAGVFIVAGILAVVLRFTSQTSTGEVRLPRIVDESIGMWLLRGLRARITGRGSASAESGASPLATLVAPSPGSASSGAAASEASIALSDRPPTIALRDAPPLAAAAAVEPLDDAAAPSAAAAPAIPSAASGSFLDPMDARFAATQQRLAAAGVRRVPRSPIALAFTAPTQNAAPTAIPAVTPVPTVIPPWSPPPLSPPPVDPRPIGAATPAATFVLLPAPPPARFISPIPPDRVPAVGRVPAARGGWTSRRAVEPASDAASSPGRGAAVRVRVNVAALATALTLAVVGLVAIASLQTPGPSQGSVLAATGLPEVALPSEAAEPSGAQPSGASAGPSRPAASAARSQAKPTPTARP